MPIYNFKLTDDLTVPVTANSQEEAERILKAEIVKKEASPLFDKMYFDYETGINVPSLRAKLGRQEKTSEKERVLTAEVTKQGYTRTTKNEFAITPEGQKILIDKGLMDEDKYNDTKNIVIDEEKFGSAGDWADFSGAVGPIAGSILALNPYFRAAKGLQFLFKSPMLSRVIATGLGGATGKGAEEALDAAQGFRDKDANETADLLRTEFAIGAVAQGIGEFGSKAFGAFFGRKAGMERTRDFWVVANNFSMDDVIKLDGKLGRVATEADIKAAAKRGEVVRYDGLGGVASQKALERAIPARMQAAGETIFGKVKREQSLIDYNFNALAQLKNKIAKKKAEISEQSKLYNNETGLPKSKVIEELKVRRGNLEKQEKEISQALNNLIEDMSLQTGGFSNSALQGQKELGENIQNIIAQSYKDIQNSHATNYNKIFSEVKKLNPQFEINASPMLREINEAFDMNKLLAARGDDANFKLILELKKVLEKQNGVVSIQDLLSFRSDLVGAGIIKVTMNGGKQGNLIERMVELLDETITDLPNQVIAKTKVSKKFVGPLPSNPVTQTQKDALSKVVTDLRNENAAYFKNHLPFDKMIVQNIKNSQAIDPGDVYEAVFKIHKTGDMNAFIAAIPEAERAVFKNTILRRYIKDTAEGSVDDAMTGIINPSKFAGKVLKNKKLLTPLLGNRAGAFFQTMDDFVKLKPNLDVTDLKTLADDMTGRIGQMEASGGMSEPFERFIKNLNAKIKNSSDIADLNKSTIFKNIANSNPEDVVKAVFRPKSSEDILRVKSLVSDDAFVEIQEQALEQIIKDSVQQGSTNLTDIFKIGNLERALKMYGSETVEAMFGKEVARGLNSFTRTLRTTVGSEGGSGAGTMVAATLALNIFNVALLPVAASLGVYKAIFGNARIVSMLAKTDKSSVLEVVRFVEKTLRLMGTREFESGVSQVGDVASSQLQEILKSEEGAEANNILKDSFRDLNETKKQISTEIALPDISPVNLSAQSQAPISRSLLGNSPANEDIAQSQGRLA
mgnify:FL=1